MVTTKASDERAELFPRQFTNNQLIQVAEVDLHDKYEADEKSRGRCRYKKVYATTTDGVRFLLWDDVKRVSNARQYGSGGDPVTWGH